MQSNGYKRAARNAAKAYGTSDKARWVAAYWAAQIVGTYTSGTLQLATEMGVSPDTIENLAHAYWMYEALRDEVEFRRNVQIARRLPKVYISHFASLYTAWQTYSLTLPEVYSILIDVVQARGKLSSHDVDQHVRDHYGKERSWDYYGRRTHKAIGNTLACPDLPGDVRAKLQESYEILGELS